MELCDASKIDVKVFHLILSPKRLVLSLTIIIKKNINVQGAGKDQIPFITFMCGKNNVGFGLYYICQKTRL